MRTGLFLYFFTFTLASSSLWANTPSTTSCLKLSDDYCQNLYSPQNQGNLDDIKLGYTSNDINHAKFYFLKAVEKSFSQQAPDIQKTLKKSGIINRIHKYIHRKKRNQRVITDLYLNEWTSDSIDTIKQAFEQLARERTVKKIPSYLHELNMDTDPSSEMERGRQLDIIWADFFKTVWQNDPAWKNVEKKFEIIRQEYILWNESDQTISDELRKFRHEQLKTLTLMIPGAARNRAYDTRFRCGIDQDNAFYSSLHHQLTVCAGGFVGNEPLLTIAHEVGHSISNTRRIYKYIEGSAFGQNFAKLWYDIQKGNHLTCEQWGLFKKGLEKNVEELKPYRFEDEKFLSRFITKELRNMPNDAEVRRITARLSKRTLNDEIRNNVISRIIKKNEILESGRSIPNKSYLNPEALIRWSWLPNAIFSSYAHFDNYFVEEYNCLFNEKKLPETKALEEALIEARKLVGLSWKMKLNIGGKFSFFAEAIEEEIAQDVEEDVVDAYSSTVVARLLKKIESIEERRTLFLKSTASYCDPISFRQLYPAETNIMHKFTNAVHSIGQDRRKKLMSEDVKPLLQCE